jgi:hypothetical protein
MTNMNTKVMARRHTRLLRVQAGKRLYIKQLIKRYGILSACLL